MGLISAMSFICAWNLSLYADDEAPCWHSSPENQTNLRLLFVFGHVIYLFSLYMIMQAAVEYM